jgi:hypothetical protein
MRVVLTYALVDGVAGDFVSRSVASSRLLFSAFTIAAFVAYSAFGSSFYFGSTFSPLISKSARLTITAHKGSFGAA